MSLSHLGARSTFALPLSIAILYGLLLGGCVGTPYVPPSTDSTEESSGESVPRKPSNTTSEPTEPNPDDTKPPQDIARKNAAGVLLAQSETLRQNGQLPQAVALLERAIRLEPSRGDLWVQLGRLRFEGGELARAEQYARKGIALTRGSAPARRLGWLLLADISDSRGDDQGAQQIRARWLNDRG